MKISAVSIPHFTSTISPFMYTANENYKAKFSIKENKANYIAGLAAVILAIVSIKKLAAKNTIPKSVVEISRKNSGLNKLDFGEMTSAHLKDKILYPLKCLLLNSKKQIQGEIKTGLIIADKDEIKLKTYLKAFLSHAQALGIDVIEIKYPNKRHQAREVHKALDRAIEYNKTTGKPVIVNIRDLGKISNLKTSKMETASNLEKRLANTPKGVLWTAITTDGENLPYFYNNIPTLSVKIID